MLVSSRRRAVWLGVNLIAAFLAAWVIGRFEATLEQIQKGNIRILLNREVGISILNGVLWATDVVGFFSFLGLATVLLL